MTTEEILELAKTCGFDSFMSKTTNANLWECEVEDLLEFAKAIYEEGYDDGCFQATGGN